MIRRRRRTCCCSYVGFSSSVFILFAFVLRVFLLIVCLLLRRVIRLMFRMRVLRTRVLHVFLLRVLIVCRVVSSLRVYSSWCVRLRPSCLCIVLLRHIIRLLRRISILHLFGKYFYCYYSS